MPEELPDTRKELVVRSEFENLDSVVQETEDFVRLHEGDDDVVYNIMLLTSEAVTNAMEHGNGLDPSKEVKIAFEAGTDHLIISVQDQGNGFSEEGVPNPLDDENLLAEGGRGLYLMHALADEIRYEDGGRRVVMRFSRSGK
ncbi:ATP-binding protein [Rhodothermus sp. AH-315-K08]|nr:ATP-binding protein [Rhodothermus sp. AH-315-K08]